MKNSFLYIAIFLFSASLYSAEPLVKFYLNDGSTKQYNLSEIDSLLVIDKKNNYVLRIHYDDSLIAYYPTEIIGSIKFENDSLNVYIFSYPKPYKISCIDSLIFYIDLWQPLTIGSQVWMLKNLNVDHYRNGESIPEVQDTTSWSNLTTGAWCFYNNDSAMEDIYGKLYNWGAVKDPRGLAPSGWQVPSDAEWATLTTYLGGESIAGEKLKETGTSHWIRDNTGATNSSGFSALPGALRNYIGAYNYIEFNGYWWSSTEYNTSKAWYRSLSWYDAFIYRSYFNKVYGFSVRCV